MKTFGLALVLLLVLPFGAGARAPQSKRAAVAKPDAVVRELYRVHRKGYGHVFVREGRKLQERFFDENLARLIWKDLTETPPDIVGRLDFDPLYNAQDTQIKSFRVGAGVVKGDTAGVPVTFVNLDQKVKIDFRLVRVKGVWKISNIVYGGGSDLLAILSAPM